MSVALGGSLMRAISSMLARSRSDDDSVCPIAGGDGSDVWTEEDDCSAKMLSKYEKKWAKGDVGKTLSIGKELETWLVRDMTINGLAKIMTSQGVDSMYHPMEIPISGQFQNLEKIMAGVRPIRFAIRPFVELISQMIK